MKHILLFIVVLVLSGIELFGQTTKLKVLFLGNSFTYVNNLPQITADIAASMGDTLIYDKNLKGGYSLYNHRNDPTTISKIMQGKWDYVVLQEGIGVFLNSPSFYDFSSALYLDRLINICNRSCETMIYLPWARKFGCCASLPCPAPSYTCTYAFQDSIINRFSTMTADTIKAPVSPVRAVWNHLIRHYPNLELYNADFAHPSVEGTYVAACCFYTVLFKKNPEQIPYVSTLTETNAKIIKNAVKSIVYDSLSNWRIDRYPKDPCCKTLRASVSESSIGSASDTITLTVASNTEWLVSANQSWLRNSNNNFSGSNNDSLTFIADANPTNKERMCTITLFGEGVPTQTFVISQQHAGQSASSTCRHSSSIAIIPNPVSDQFYVSGIESEWLTFNIYNQINKKVLSGYINRGEPIKVGHLPSGFYFVVLKDKNLVSTHRLIKIGK